MNLSQIIGIAKAVLPANSPWLERIDQAAQMAKSFSPSKDGIAQLMAAQGKKKSDLIEAVKMLEHPLVNNLVGRVPGLKNILNGAANELMKDPNMGAGNTSDYGNSGTGSMPNSGSSFESLQARLNRLK